MSPAWIALYIFAIFVVASFGASMLYLVKGGCSSVPARRRRRRD